MIVVTGSVTAREDSFDEVRRLSLEHVHRSRKEPGCISHAVHVDCENPVRLVFIEHVPTYVLVKVNSKPFQQKPPISIAL